MWVGLQSGSAEKMDFGVVLHRNALFCYIINVFVNFPDAKRIYL
jgi:hypothetical protein